MIHQKLHIYLPWRWKWQEKSRYFSSHFFSATKDLRKIGAKYLENLVMMKKGLIVCLSTLFNFLKSKPWWKNGPSTFKQPERCVQKMNSIAWYLCVLLFSISMFYNHHPLFSLFKTCNWLKINPSLHSSIQKRYVWVTVKRQENEKRQKSFSSEALDT